MALGPACNFTVQRKFVRESDRKMVLLYLTPFIHDVAPYCHVNSLIKVFRKKRFWFHDEEFKVWRANYNIFEPFLKHHRFSFLSVWVNLKNCATVWFSHIFVPYWSDIAFALTQCVHSLTVCSPSSRNEQRRYFTSRYVSESQWISLRSGTTCSIVSTKYIVSTKPMCSSRDASANNRQSKSTCSFTCNRN